MAYLALEKLPQHRERLADLLWNTVEARKNLRVELARIRSAGLDIFPLSRQLLSLDNVSTDFDVWQAAQHQEMNQAELSAWLAALRGLPLSGLEDLGSPAFQEWVEQQRWMMSEQIEHVLNACYWRYARAHQTWATRLIVARAEALGFEHPCRLPDLAANTVAPPVPNLDLEELAPHGRDLDADFPEPREPASPPPAPPRPTEEIAAPSPDPALSLPSAQIVNMLRFERPVEERALQALWVRAAQQPQMMVLSGAPGSGKSELAELLGREMNGLTIHVRNAHSSRLVLATLAQALSVEVESAAATLGQVLLQPAGLEEDMVKISVALAQVSRPTLVVIDHAHHAAPELAPLLEFLWQLPAIAPRVLLLLSREPANRAPLTRALLHADGLTCLDMTPLTHDAVHSALEAQFVFESAEAVHSVVSRLLQLSEGNPLHLRSLLAHAPDLAHLDRRAARAAYDRYSGEIDRWPAELVAALGRLSVIYGRFDERLARAALGDASPEATRHLLYTALTRHLFVEADPEVPLRLPDFEPVVNASEPEPHYMFRDEGLRGALAAQLPQLVRQEVRQRLVQALAPTEPGLAALYADRAGLHAEAERLRRAHTARLAEEWGEPASAVPPSFPAGPFPALVAAPRRAAGKGAGPVTRQGYVLRLHEGWLSVLSTSRYGPPYTLRLHVDLSGLPADAEDELRIVWRLDLFEGGQEFGTARRPFALRLGTADSDVHHVLATEPSDDYREGQVWQRVHSGVVIGQWMEHRVQLGTHGAHPAKLELSVRALDVALTIGSLSWGGHDLLGAPSTVKPGIVNTPSSEPADLIPHRPAPTTEKQLN